MLADLLRRAPATPDPRAALRQAQQRAQAARQAAQAAAGAAERARAVVDRARAALAGYDAVDGRVAQHRAAALRAGADHAALPADLVAARAEQDAAKRELADAEAALRLLEAEERAAVKASEAAAAELHAATDAVVLDVAAAMVPALEAAEREAGRRRAELAGLLASRTPLDAPVPWAVGLVHDPAHAAFIERAPPNSANPAAWTAFRRALLSDAGVEFRGAGGGNG